MTQRYAYAPSGNLEIFVSPKRAAEMLVRDFETQWSAQSIQRWSKAELNSKNLYPVIETNTAPPSEHHVKFNLTDIGVTPEGDWERQRVWVDPALSDVKASAKKKLAIYYKAYVQSRFDVQVGQNTITFSASPQDVNFYQTINAFVKEDPANVSYAVLDIDNNPQLINTEAQWNVFWAAYKQLWIDTRVNVITAWQAVQDAATIAEVDTAINALPEVPSEPIT